MATLTDFVALSLLPISWWRDVATALRVGESPRLILERLLDERSSEGLTAETLRRRAAGAVALADERRIDPITWTDPDYPPALAAIIDPPPVLWVCGQRAAFEQPAVAIVGSRAGSPYALSVAEHLAADLARCGVAVVSGLARGVDSAAHRGALGGGGITIGVLGSGADVIYPREHRDLSRQMAVSGAIVSELVPGTPPRAHFFPRRNRIISGLARAVVVIEAGEKSGSLITARCALEQGREVLAVPGHILGGRNKGGHALLRDGAKIVETADDILEELQFVVRNPGPVDSASNPTTPARVDPVLGCMAEGECCDLDEIAERTGLTPARLLPRLFDLELRGVVRRAGGGRFIRFDRSC
ncbi:MAG: DNA-protecting protein DprA [Acidobacteria bacterium]|nr:DNA-protecting protein DprA [Acidobacteriota bacterium]